MADIAERAMKIDGVIILLTVAGYSMLGGGGENVAFGVVGLEEWAKRTSKNLSIEAITEKLTEEFGQTPGAEVNFFAPPSIPALAKAAVCRWNFWQPMPLLPRRTYIGSCASFSDA